mmetsp:Transcript_92150/g.269638  ORF Transcript_92150/g.269638 Transcript_92150/m.269638 type:complete len:251 (-) Transcript_92150:147-899(-)
MAFTLGVWLQADSGVGGKEHLDCCAEAKDMREDTSWRLAGCLKFTHSKYARESPARTKSGIRRYARILVLKVSDKACTEALCKASIDATMPLGVSASLLEGAGGVSRVGRAFSASGGVSGEVSAGMVLFEASPRSDETFQNTSPCTLALDDGCIARAGALPTALDALDGMDCLSSRKLVAASADMLSTSGDFDFWKKNEDGVCCTSEQNSPFSKHGCSANSAAAAAAIAATLKIKEGPSIITSSVKVQIV